MGTLTTVVDDKYISLIDKTINVSKAYSSRSEFLKEAVREKLIKLIQFNNELADINAASKKLALKAIANGWDGSLITREQKIEAANKLFKEKGWIK